MSFKIGRIFHSFSMNIMNAYLFIIIHNLTNKELKSLHYKNIQFAI